MKSLKIHFAILVTCLLLLVVACSKSATTTALPANRFTWTYLYAINVFFISNPLFKAAFTWLPISSQTIG